MITIDIYSDPICPWCYIGKKRLEAALAERPDLPVTLRWRAFQLNPDMPNGGMGRQDYLSAKFGGSDRAREIYGHIERVGDQVGIDFQFDRIPRTPNTIKAHRLIRLAQSIGQAEADNLVTRLFQAYFIDGQDIGDDATLIDIAADAGLQRDAVTAYLAGEDEEQEVRAEDIYARRLGIGGVPCFIIDGKYALSGAQEPKAFLPLFDMAMQEHSETPKSAAE